ncbi:c-type cytochrome [Palleronia pelagia]|uniref:c-type cytochrome n=1 Tax=Palleronia pelagia TaxID=387096 RepID=UPI001F3CB126|nr:cytochrome c [Palleronia pelagia]
MLGRGGAEATAAGPVDLARGRALYEENCSSCHGSELQGQPDWQSPGPDGRLPAPPHDETGHTWHHPDTVLFDYTKLGGNALMAQQGVDFDSGMPGFGDILTDRQIRDVLAFIRSTWPERIRDIQADRTLAQDGAG